MDVRLPDGSIITNVPEGTTRAQLQARIDAAKSRMARSDQRGNFGLLTDRLTSWIPFADETAGVGNAIGKTVRSMGVAAKDIVTGNADRVTFDPSLFGREYEKGKKQAQFNAREAKNRTPVAAQAADVVGFLGSLGAPGKAKVEIAKNLAGRIKQGATIGAIGGGVQGFAANEGLDRVGGAAFGATVGAGLGAAIPIGGQITSDTYQGIKRFVRPDNGLARQVVGQAIVDGGMTPRQVGALMDEARERGSMPMLADMNDELRGLTGSLSRQPGPSRTVIRTAVDARQMGQTDRVRDAISRDLGAIMDPYQVADDLTKQAQNAAAPLYKKAYQAGGQSSDEIAAILQTPAGKSALVNARNIAANERRDPTALGFDLNDAGEVVLKRVPSIETLDYVKRGLDDVLEPYRDKVTGRLVLDESGRAIDRVRKQLISEMDKLNPTYKAARDAYAGPASQKTAMELGRKALNMAPRDINRAVGRMSAAEREQFALGYRVALSDALDKTGDAADKVTKLLGTPAKRNALARVFGGRQNFDRFIATMADERAANETYRAVMTGSPTAGRMADDVLTNDAGLLEQASDAALRGAQNGGLTGAIANVWNAMNNARRMGAGEAGKRVRQEAAALLSETDPALLREALIMARKEQIARNIAARRASGRYLAVDAQAGRAAGALTPYLADEPR